MFVVREVLHCRPGRVKELVGKFQSLGAVMTRLGYQPFRMMTDVSGERFWSLVLESEAEDLAAFRKMESDVMGDADAQAAMQGYHELVIEGRREIFTLV